MEITNGIACSSSTPRNNQSQQRVKFQKLKKDIMDKLDSYEEEVLNTTEETSPEVSVADYERRATRLSSWTDHSNSNDLEMNTQNTFVKVSLESDKSRLSRIVDIAGLNKDILVLIDAIEYTVRLFDINTNQITSALTLDHAPYGVAVLPDTNLVTTHDRLLSSICFDSKLKMKVKKQEKVNGLCRGICCGESLYVAVIRPDPCIQIYGMAFDLKRSIPLHSNAFPISIEISNKRMLFITDSNENGIFQLPISGKIRLKSMCLFGGEPISLTKDGEGNLYAIEFESKNIHKICKDGRTVMNLHSIEDAEDGLLAVTFWEERQALVCSGNSAAYIFIEKNVYSPEKDPEKKPCKLGKTKYSEENSMKKKIERNGNNDYEARRSKRTKSDKERLYPKMKLRKKYSEPIINGEGPGPSYESSLITTETQ